MLTSVYWLGGSGRDLCRPGIKPCFVSFKNSDQVMDSLGIDLIAGESQPLSDTL
jgi:hypothetical protein